MGKWVDGLIYAWMGRWTDEWFGGWMDGMWMDGWMDGWMGGWNDGLWINGRMDGWIDRKDGDSWKDIFEFRYSVKILLELFLKLSRDHPFSRNHYTFIINAEAQILF